jgi:UDP-2,4-diacetamido-2,4,6-trideoxy-beta-L-altropyranose hydrolase
VILRSAEPGDARLVFEWANDHDTRAASFRSAQIPWGEHETWFAARLGDAACRFFIAEHDGRPVGQIRLAVEGSHAEVHLNVAAAERGQGHGLEMLRLACAEAEGAGIRGLVAHVKPDNASSLALFERAGFTRRGRVTLSGHEADRLEWFAHDPRAAHVLFVVDGTAATGLGHVVRCSALASGLRRIGIASTFLAGEHPAVRDKILAVGATHVRDNRGGQGDLDADEVLGVAHSAGADAIVLDSYFADRSMLARLHGSGLKLVVIDDLAQLEMSADLVVNGGAHASALRYAVRSDKTRLLLGPDFALLREPFWAHTSRVCRSRVQNVVVTMGGGATGTLAEAAVTALEDVVADFDIAVLRSALAPAPSGSASSRRVSTLVDPPDVRSCFVDADLAVCAGGQTIYELAAVGTPAVAVQVSGNQAGSMAAMQAAGVLRAAGSLEDDGVWRSMRRAVEELCARYEERQAMTAAGQRLVYGRGALRVAEAIGELVRTRVRPTGIATDAAPGVPRPGAR